MAPSTSKMGAESLRHLCPMNAPSLRQMSPQQALQGVIEAESIIKNLTQAKLEALAGWVGSAPAHALAFPDLGAGLAMVHEVAGKMPATLKQAG